MKFYNWVGKIEVIIAKYCLLIMTTLVFVSALSRKFGHPMSWAVDVSTFLFAWAVFLGGDAALRNDSMVSIDMFVAKLPQKVQKIITAFNYIVMSVFLAVMAFYGVKLSISTYFRTFSGLSWLSYTWVTISVPLGCFLMLVTILIKTKKLFSKGGAAA